MATIHVLKPAASQHDLPSRPEVRPSAQIILFPGVRYERWTEAGAPAQATADKQKRKRRSRVKRDTMTIVV